MKIKYFLNIVIGTFLMPNIINAQGTNPGNVPLVNGIGTTDAAHDTVWITGGLTNPGNPETVINGDTIMKGPGTGFGKRVNPNTVYVLAANTIYLEQAGLLVNDSAGTLTIIGLPSGGNCQKPVLLHDELFYVLISSSQINANLTIKNIQYESEDLQGAYPGNGEGDFFIHGANHTVDIENCLFEFCNLALVNVQSVPQGLKVFYRGNYFRDFFNGIQWWGGRPFYGKVPIDTFVFENNTTTNTGLLCLTQNSLTAFALINHNTIINNLKYPFLNPVYLECYFTNNLIINSNLAGDDSLNIIKIKAGDPDGLRDGVIGIDTIDTRLVTEIQNKYKKGTGFDTSQVGLSHIKFFAASNVLTADSNKVFYNYWHGIKPNDAIGNHAKDSAASYLNWNVPKPGPYGLVNYPETFINSRGYALAKTHKNIVIAGSNSLYSMPTQALKMKTSCLDTSQVNYWIQFNRSQYNVPAYAGSNTTVANPPFSKRITFGDADPTTIPGPGGLEIPYTQSTGGITAFSDLKENFSQTVVFSSIDGLPVGSLIWGPGNKTFNETTDLKLIKQAYAGMAKYLEVNTNFLNIANPANSIDTFTISSDTAWSIYSKQTWLTPNKTSGTNNNTITVTAEYNNNLYTRTDTLIISVNGLNNDTVFITQEGNGNLSISTDTINIGYAANSQAIFYIYSNVSWTAKSNQNWLITNITSGYDSSGITLTCSENPDIETRTAIVNISGNGLLPKYLTVTQEGIPPVLSVSPGSLSAITGHSQLSFNITSNTSWSVKSNRSWLIPEITSGSDDLMITLSVLANLSVNERSGDIIVSANGVKADTVHISQAAGFPFINVSPNSFNLTSEAYQNGFMINSNVNWNIINSQPWVELTPAAGVDTVEISFSVSANKAIYPRTDTIIVTYDNMPEQTIVLEQPAALPELIISENRLAIGAGANSQTSFTVNSNIIWIIKSKQPWLTVDNTFGSDTALITMTASANTQNTQRIDTVIVSGNGLAPQYIIVTQDPGDGISDITKDDVDLYPVPVVDNLIIFTPYTDDNKSFVIYNISGTELYSSIISTSITTVDMSLYSPGIYIIKIITQDNGLITKKIIKE